MITTGANPQAAMVMAIIKSGYGKSVTSGIANAVAYATSPIGERMEKAALQNSYNSIKSMVSTQCSQGQ